MRIHGNVGFGSRLFVPTAIVIGRKRADAPGSCVQKWLNEVLQQLPKYPFNRRIRFNPQSNPENSVANPWHARGRANP